MIFPIRISTSREYRGRLIRLKKVIGATQKRARENRNEKRSTRPVSIPATAGQLMEMDGMHKFHLVAALLAGSLAAVPGAAQAQSALGPYIALGLGYDQMPDRNLVVNGRAVSSQWKPGWGALAALGYKWFFGLRTEAEYIGRVSWVKSFNQTNPWAGTAWDNSVMVNGLYDFEFDSPITPFVGGGLGLNQIQWGNNFRVPTQVPPTIYDGESIRPGWQGIAGLSYAVTPQIALAVDGRVKGSFGHFNFPGSVAGKSINQFNYETRSIFVSVRYAFGG